MEVKAGRHWKASPLLARPSQALSCQGQLGPPSASSRTRGVGWRRVPSGPLGKESHRTLANQNLCGSHKPRQPEKQFLESMSAGGVGEKAEAAPRYVRGALL